MLDRCNMKAFLLLFSSFLLFNCTFEQQFLISRNERLALLELRSSLGLRAKEWPIKSDPCSSWVGIQCSNGRVTGINISGFRRTRKGSQNPQFSVASLKNLTLLASFNASKFLLPGSVPDWFGLQVNALQVLDLRSCSINGAIPFTLGNLSSLSELYLSDNGFTGTVPSSLGQLSALSILNLSGNSLTGSIPATLGDLGNLTALDMSKNFLSGSIPLEIGKLNGLRSLNLSGNSLSSSIPPQLGDLSNLVDLDLGSNAILGSLPPDIRGLRNLQSLMIGNNFLSGSVPGNLFPSLTQLRYVDLSHNGFLGDFPSVIWSIPSLQFLDVSVNNFTGVLPSVSSSINTSAAIVNISSNLFYGILTPIVGRFRVMDMSGNYFEGPVPGYARLNSNLTGNCLQNSSNQRSLEECTSFYVDRNLVFDNFGEPNTQQSPPPPFGSRKKSHKLAIILASVFGAIGLVVLVIIIVLLLILCKRKNGNGNQRGVGVEPVPSSGGAVGPPSPGVPLNFSKLGDSLTYQQILQATNEFNQENLIKRGHSGELFRGILEGSVPVVIKKVDTNAMARKESYMMELEFFTKISNPRFVPLLGHSLENENEKFLVYKHMRYGDLSSSLFKKASSDDGLQSLDWITRLKIAIGAAEGLSYLHHECSPPLVHRDVQASSILLDDKFEVRLGSLSEVCAQEGETQQNRFTRLLRLPQSSEQGSSSATPNATCAYDVYCFGKVLLELVTGKLGLSSPSTEANTKEYLEQISIYDKDMVTNIVDPTLIIDDDLLEEVWAMAVIAKSCLNPKPNRRPLMRYILKALENPLKVVREENGGSSSRLRATSSRGSWNAALFGSWRHSSSEVAVNAPPSMGTNKIEGTSSFNKQSGSQGSGQNGDGNNGHSSSTRRQSKEIFPEPLDVEGLHED